MAPESGETIVARKRGLRPSELRNIQRRQRVNNEEKGGIIPLLPALESSSSRIPLASLTINSINLDQCTDQNSINRLQPPSKQDWSIKKQVNIILFDENPNIEQDMRKSFETNFTYWSFPYPPINQGTLKRISQLLSRQSINSSLRPEEADERDFFKRICENWKAALVSLFGNFQKCTDRQTGYFFYLHRSLVALFRRTVEVEVILANVTPFLEAALKDEGIRFDVVGKGQSDALETNCPSKNSDKEYNSEEEEDQENINPNEIKLLINSQLKRNAARKAESSPQGTKILLIQGDLHVRTLVDYLLNNQHDGPATPLLPELLAPWPFLYGTQVGVDVGVGSLVVTKRGLDGTEGRKHVQIGPGVILPHALSRIVKEFGNGMESFVVGGIHQLSEPFSMLTIC